MNKVKKLLIVGGGNSGFITALILKTRFPKMEIDMVFSKNIPITGVGETTTSIFFDFINFVGLDITELLVKTGSTFKTSTLFKGWTEKDFFVKYPSFMIRPQFGQKKLFYLWCIANNKHLNDFMYETEVNNCSYDGQVFPTTTIHQFHFNTFLLNQFLRDKVEERGCIIYDDEIVDMDFSDDGNIKSVIGKKQRYEYDFYIDSTGPNRKIINLMGSQWVTYDCIKVNSALIFQTEPLLDIPVYTTIEAMDAGWKFQIPVMDHTGNGYVYDDKYITDEQAKSELEKTLQCTLNDYKIIKFNSGYSDKVWVKNCCVTGLGSILMDPMEASSLSTTINQTFLFMHKLVNYDDNSIDAFNLSMKNVFDNIRDFVVLHYLTEKTNTQFWIDASNMKLPESLKKNMKLWKNNLPIHEDISTSSYLVFGIHKFITIMLAFNKFDVDSLKEEYYSLPDNIRSNFEYEVKQITNVKSQQKKKHREVLNMMHDLFKNSI